MDRETALRRLRACLRLASSSNSNEAATALRQAQAMMAAYGLTVDDVDKDAIHEQAAKTRSRGGDLPAHIWELAQLVARLFSAFVYERQEWVHTTVCFVGRGPAAELADYAFTVLRRQLETDVSKHVARCRKRKSRSQRGAAFGCAWVSGLRSKLALPDLPPGERDALKATLGVELTSTAVAPIRGKPGDDYAGFLAGRRAELRQGVDGHAQKLLEASPHG